MKHFIYLVLIVLIGLNAGIINAQTPATGTPITIENAAQVSQIGVLEGHEASVLTIAFDRTSTLLASAGDDYTVRVWNLATADAPIVLTGHTESVSGVGFGLDSTLTSYSGRYGHATANLWNWETQELIDSYGEIGWTGFSVSPDGKLFATSACVSAEMPAFVGNDVLCSSVALVLSDTETGAEVQMTDGVIGGNIWTVGGITFNQTGDLIATSSLDGAVNIISTDMKRIETIWQGRKGSVFGLNFSPDGQTLAVGSGDGVYLLDVETGEEINLLDTGTAASVAFNLDGRLLAVGANNTGEVQLWDVEANEKITTLSGHSDTAIAVAFSPDGTMLASGSFDSTIRIWGVEPTTTSDTASEDSAESTMSVTTPDGVLTIVGVTSADKYPMGCDPSPSISTTNGCWFVADEGYKLVFVVFDSSKIPNTPDEVYVTVGDNKEYLVAAHGMDSRLIDGGAGYVIFVVPETTASLILYWPENTPITLEETE